MSGFEPAEAAGSDSGLLLAALGRPVTMEAIAQVSPWRFALPLALDMAAAREGRRLDYAAMLAFCGTAMAEHREPLLIEGAGGVMSPVDHEHTVLDWIAALRLPLILVAGSYLGTISHTLTALDAVARRGLTVVSVVISQSADNPVPLEDTRATIARFATPLEVVALPRLSGEPAHPALDRLAGRM
jgi:dethiobiotin synthetase